jgi:inhibitor of cysteine peptidase
MVYRQANSGGVAMFRIHILTIFLTALLVLGACGQGPRVLSVQDAGTTVELRPGEKVELVLVGNPTTGFTWEIETLDEAVLKQSGDPLYKSDREVPGSPGKFTFRFEAVGVGQTTLRLIYHRPFEEDTPPVDTFELTVIVQ